ncbi:hypothetical protein [uncultured Roseibium sp.]|uniref:hypothetical protein n=1 Tax=uncultured Roseibium sp. TaxID=1936171 RepID=UPI003217805B
MKAGLPVVVSILACVAWGDLASAGSDQVTVRLTRGELIRLVRSELWRVGCLDDPDGQTWGRAERAAARAFASATRSRVGTYNPSPELLALLAGASDKVCAPARSGSGSRCFTYNRTDYCQ